MHEKRQASHEREARWRAWMTAAQRGDSAAYEKLLVELLPHIRRFVRRRVYDPEAGVEANGVGMSEAALSVATGEVTSGWSCRGS